MLGLKSQDAIQSQSINTESALSFVAFGICIISNFVYLVRYADSFFEYVESLYAFFASSISTVIYGFFTWKMMELFEFINNLETTIQHSKQRYYSFNLKIKKFLHTEVRPFQDSTIIRHQKQSMKMLIIA